MYIGLHVMYP